MKPKASLRSFLALSGSALLAISTAQADTLYWDGGDTGANAQGGNGTWDTSSSNWDTAATAGVDAQWTSSPADYAVFGTPAGTVTVDPGITTSGMQFNVHSYIIDASTNALNFATGNNTISTNFTSASGNITSITGTVAGGVGANLLFTALNPLFYSVGNIISFEGASAGGWGGTTTIDKFMVVRLKDTNQALLNTSGITLRGGVLVLTNAAAQNTLNRVNDSAIINSYGGSIRTNNTSTASTNYVENLGELKLNGGLTTLIHNINNSSSGRSQLLSFSNITRTSGSYGTLYVGAASTIPNSTGNMIRNASITTATANDKNIGPWLTLGNNTYGSPDYGKYDASGNIIVMTRSAGNILTNLQESSLTTAWADTANFQWVAAALTANRVVNTAKITGGTVELANFSFATNGILGSGSNVTFQSTTGGSTGYLTAAGGVGNDNANVLYLNSATGNLFVNAPVKDNGNPVTLVATSGTGRIQLNAVNEHTGGTVISSQIYRNVDGQDANPGSTSKIILQNASALGANTNLLRVESGYLDLSAQSPTVGKFEGYVSGMVTGNGSSQVLTVGNGTLSSDVSDFAGTLNNISLTKTGAGTQILSGTNVSGGAITVSEGTLRINGSTGSGAVAVADLATLGGNGTVGGATTFTGASIHAPGSAATTVGTQAFSSTVTYGTGTIFEWDFDSVSAADPGAVNDAATGTYDKVTATGAITGGAAVFKVVLAAGDSFTDAFWNTNKSWTDIFGGANLATVFSGFDATGGLDSTGLVTGEGQFTFSGSNLNWTAIPEPTSALAGLLLAAGLLRRRRTA